MAKSKSGDSNTPSGSENAREHSEMPSAMRSLLAGAANDLVKIAFSQAAEAASKAEGPHGKAMVQMFDKLQNAFEKDFSKMLPGVDIETDSEPADVRDNQR